jgi:translocation and assembly module TamB
MLPGQFSASASGRIVGPIEIRDLSYSSADMELSVKRIFFDWRPLSLFLLRFRISTFHAEHADLRFSAERPDEVEKEHKPFKAPLDIIVDGASVSDINITQPESASPFTITNMNLAARMSGGSIRIDEFGTTIPMFELVMNGTIDLSEDYPLDVETRWLVRIDGYPDISGNGSIRGSLKKLAVSQDSDAPFQASLHASILNIMKNPQWDADLDIASLETAKIKASWPDIRLAGNIRSSGNSDGLLLHSLYLKVLGGELQGEGHMNWSGETAWGIKFSGRALNPGEAWPDFPGKLDLSVSADAGGEGKERHTSINVEIADGTIRGRAVRAEGKFEIADGAYLVKGLKLRSGSAYLQARGMISPERYDVQWKLRAPALGDLLPRASGNISGQGSLGGPRDMPRVKASVSGSGITASGYKADRLSAEVDIELSGTGDTQVDLQAKNILIDRVKIASLSIKGTGKAADHKLNIDISTNTASVSLTLSGGFEKKIWSGVLARSRFTVEKTGAWTQNQPVPLSLSGDKIALSPLCLVNDGAKACLEGEWEKGPGSQGKIVISRLPLTALSPLLPAYLNTEGTVSGSAQAVYSTDRVVRGHVSLVMSPGTITFMTADGEKISFPYERGELKATLDEKALIAHIAQPLKGGSINGNLTLPQFNPLNFAASKQPLEGTLRVELSKLDFLPAFLPDVKDTEGTFTADITASGTLADPLLKGTTVINKGAASIPSLGIRLSYIRLSARSGTGESIDFHAEARSGGGMVRVEGNTLVVPEDGWPTEMSITGEKFEIVNIPEAWIVADPDATVHTRKNRIDVKGAVHIPEARFEPRDLSGAVKPSPDVIIVDTSVKSSRPEALQIFSSIKISLGEKVSFNGFGLKGLINGAITVVDAPERLTTGSGELGITKGEYSAYGQDLQIEYGRLIFAGSPIDNPGLDIRAVRRIKEVTAGVDASGTLNAPVLTLFSKPPMDETDILSYLLIGRPLSGATASEGNFLYNAALKAGLKGGGLIASKIGARLGLDEVSIASGDTPKESSLLIGKYLSPRLYVSYAIGLFQPTNVFRVLYELSKHWSVQAERGIATGADILYRIEK